MKSSEWSLVIFTIFVQMAVGSFLILGIGYNFFFLKNENGITHQLTSKILFSISSIIIISLFISFMHLGNPKNAIYALRNISSSWLSREILFVGLFAGLVSFFAFCHDKEIFTSQVRNVLALIALSAGLVSIFTMSKIYMIPTVPAWNNSPTPIQFYLTAFILGIATFLAGLILFSGKLKIDLNEVLQFEKITKILLIITIILLTLQLVVWLLHISSLSGGGLAGRMSYSLVMKEYAPLFYARIFLAVSSIILIVYFILGIRENLFDTKLYLLSFILVIISEIIGRYLFYLMFARTGV